MVVLGVAVIMTMIMMVEAVQWPPRPGVRSRSRVDKRTQ